MNIKLVGCLCVSFWLCAMNYCLPAWAKVYEAGPGKAFEELHEVPFDTFQPGDHLKIYYREKPYKTIFIIRKSGQKGKPIIIEGVPDQGRLPVIDGNGALQVQADHSKQYGRWLIKVGDKVSANYIILKNLHLKSANNTNGYRFKGRMAGYQDNAGGVFIKRGKNIKIINCVIRSCGNGVISGYMPDVNNVLIDSCIVYDNGNHKNPGSAYEHNIYMGSGLTVIQFSKIFTPRSGHCLKDRSRKTIIRYNWIEGGQNRQLDFVDHQGYRGANAVVYGNVIIQGKRQQSRNMIHWGGDQNISRTGVLYLFNNTIVGRSSWTQFVVTRYPDCSIQMKNNIFKGMGTLWNGVGGLIGSHNWFSSSIQMPGSYNLGIKSVSPGFLSEPANPYLLGPGSPAVDMGDFKIPVKVRFMPKPNAGRWKRPLIGNIDIGAYEYRTKGASTIDNN